MTKGFGNPPRNLRGRMNMKSLPNATVQWWTWTQPTNLPIKDFSSALKGQVNIKQRSVFVMRLSAWRKETSSGITGQRADGMGGDRERLRNYSDRQTRRNFI